ncbi:uncharacterized protein K02A2.6-like [Ornithodoros turicata]|uniref:uncharacterized protein K02A2.6-like n=1 Tax=Ornithodoros turicata TaxID=34597 RepID=UPI003139545E
MFPELPYRPSPVLVRSYSGPLSSVYGEVHVDVKYQGKECKLPLFVMREDTPTLLGRNWMAGLEIKPFKVQAITAQASVDDVVKNFPDVFSGELGTFKGASASITVQAGARPMFFKPRLVPVALQDRVAEELQRLVRERILEPVRSAEWATPIVPVVKNNEQIRICGDFNVTINPVIHVEKYPVPRVEELFAKMTGGSKFTKLDLKDAYQQIELDTESLKKFIPNLSTVLEPLNSLLSPTVRWRWTDLQEKAFQESKKLLISAEVLVHYDATKPVVLSCDASPYGVGAVVAHRDETGEERPIAFASRTLSSAERNYNQLDKETLALVFGVTKFYQYLWGRNFEAVTDHKPLLGLLGSHKPVPVHASPRLVRWALLLSSYRYHLVYRAGKSIGHADALSRSPLPTSNIAVERPGDVFMLADVYPSTLSPAAVARATRNDPVLPRVLEELWTGRHLRLALNGNRSWHAKTSSASRKIVFFGATDSSLRNLYEKRCSRFFMSHPGIAKMKSVAESHVWWKTIDADMANKVRNCNLCQEQQRSTQQVEMNPWSFPEKPWSRLHVDFGGPFKGYYFLVLVDALTKWIEVFPVTTPSAAAAIDCLKAAFATHGLPDIVVSDNGSAFTSKEFRIS